MKKIRMLFGDLIVALISLAIFASWFVLPVSPEPTAPGPQPYTAPANGAGRITCTVAEKVHVETESVVETIEEVTEEVEEVVEEVKEVVEVAEEWVECVPEADPVIETDIDALIVQVAAEYGLPWQLVRAVCWVESRFDPNAQSAHPDYGLMQVWSEVWRSYGYDPNDPIVYDPLTNLRVGCDVLKDKIINSGGELNYALTKYRFGDGDALARWANGDRTSWYAEEVLVKYFEYLRGEY